MFGHLRLVIGRFSPFVKPVHKIVKMRTHRRYTFVHLHWSCLGVTKIRTGCTQSPRSVGHTGMVHVMYKAPNKLLKLAAKIGEARAAPAAPVLTALLTEMKV